MATASALLPTIPTAPLSPAAAAALHRLELAFIPPLMSFPTQSGATIVVQSVDASRAPYRWTCSAGHDGGHAYASLPFCRDDAKAHAATCRGASVDVAKLVKVLAALGLPSTWRPRAYLGETATYLTVWSQLELNDLFEQVGGTVSTRQVERSTSDGSATWTATEITLTVDVADVGPVEIVTDIEDDPEHGYRTDLPVVAVAHYKSAEARANELIAIGRTGCMSDLDADDLAHNVDLMAGYRCQLAAAGRLDLIEVAR
jgi:hypothetical protein